jgi:two-component system KDP operon response regulator KdpE
LVTPDEPWGSRLSSYLVENNFELAGIAVNATSALTLFRAGRLDLVLIDALLPDTDGLILCQLMKTLRPSLKVVLTAKDDASLQLAALHAHTSGCINRDLPLTEWVGLLAYVTGGGSVFSQAVVEEVVAGAWPVKTGVATVHVGPLIIDMARRQVTLSGQAILLTPREFAVLACLACNVGRVVTFSQLLNEAWGYGAEMGTEAQVRLYITRLRRKLRDNPQTPTLIVSERGVGYRLRSQGQWRQKATDNLSNIFDSARL